MEIYSTTSEDKIHCSIDPVAMASPHVARTSCPRSMRFRTLRGHEKTRHARVQATEKSWGREVRPYLAERGPKQVLVEEALQMTREDGTVLLDVRLENDFEQVHAAGAINVPLFRPIQGTGMLPNPR
mmetsp:Transcript_10258/g.62746  ORF Transcript_10258/g.62746 Transcript_10258/m.62746 type:complete len:127 (+) Transcript_10258:117-497(+)